MTCCRNRNHNCASGDVTWGCKHYFGKDGSVAIELLTFEIIDRHRAGLASSLGTTLQNTRKEFLVVFKTHSMRVFLGLEQAALIQIKRAPRAKRDVLR
jgi:hypothetical protein